MDGLNTLENPTISGLKHLTLDQIDASILNADTIFLDNIETTNIIVDNQMILLTGSNILANSLNISDIELSYLDGVTSNIQDQFNAIGDINDIVYENQEKLLFQSVNESSDTTYFDGYLVPEFLQIPSWGSILANSKTISDIEISYLDGVTSNIQTQITSNKSNITVLTGRTQNLTAISGETTFIGNLKLQSGGNLLVNSLIISDVELSYLDGVTSNIQTQLLALQNKTQNLVASAGLTTSLGNISFNPSYGLLVNSKFISDVEISYLDGCSSNIQNQLNSIVSTDLVALQNKTQNQTASSGETTFSGNVTMSQLTFGYSYQVDAFTTLEKTKLSWLNITGTELLINQIKFLDDSIQTTAFTSSHVSNINSLNTKTQNQTATSGVTTFSGDTRLTTLDVNGGITCYDDNIQYKAFTNTLYDKLTNVRVSTKIYSSSLWGTTWAFNTDYDYHHTYEIIGGSDSVFSSGKVIKPGRYMITFNAHCENLKWYNKLISRIIIKDQPSGSTRATSMFAGRNLGGSVELNNENDVYYEVSLIFDCATTLDTSFAIYHEYNFASTNVSGESTVFWGEINVWEL
jgi:hypothetical protein